MLAAIFVEISGREHEEQSLACRGRHSTLRAVEQRCVERLELVCLFMGARSGRARHLGNQAWRPSRSGWFTRKSLHGEIVRGGPRDGQWREPDLVTFAGSP